MSTQSSMEFATRMTRTFWWLLPILVAMSAMAQDANFGLKVKCYVYEGTVICPGCNSRAGLSCPRNLKMESCNIKTEIPYTEQETNLTEIHGDGVETTIPGKVEPTKTTDLKPEDNPNVQQEEIDWAELAKDLEFRLFIYRILKPVEKSRRRIREVQPVHDREVKPVHDREVKPVHDREVQPTQADDDTCRWNGDCPCPLICCKTGDGCPKRCVMGIRLPPPWG